MSTLLCGPERLAELDLSVELLSDVLLRADAGIGDCTPLDPPIMAGLLRWGLTTRLLREQLVSLEAFAATGLKRLQVTGERA